jgi:hypothetical protein
MNTKAYYIPKQMTIDAPPNSLKDPNENPKMKQWKKKGVKAHFLAHNTSKVGKHVRISRWD